jgi:hypothetical protein
MTLSDGLMQVHITNSSRLSKLTGRSVSIQLLLLLIFRKWAEEIEEDMAASGEMDVEGIPF